MPAVTQKQTDVTQLHHSYANWWCFLFTEVVYFKTYYFVPTFAVQVSHFVHNYYIYIAWISKFMFKLQATGNCTLLACSILFWPDQFIQATTHSLPFWPLRSVQATTHSLTTEISLFRSNCAHSLFPPLWPDQFIQATTHSLFKSHWDEFICTSNHSPFWPLRSV